MDVQTMATIKEMRAAGKPWTEVHKVVKQDGVSRRALEQKYVRATQGAKPKRGRPKAKPAVNGTVTPDLKAHLKVEIDLWRKTEREASKRAAKLERASELIEEAGV